MLVQPYEYLLEIPGKGVRSKLIFAFNEWLKVSKENLIAVAEIVEMLHTASLL
jgi:geranylgeranyl diphosphate synthase type 3